MDGLILVEEDDSALEVVDIGGKAYYLHPVKCISKEPMLFGRNKVHLLDTGAFVLRRRSDK